MKQGYSLLSLLAVLVVCFVVVDLVAWGCYERIRGVHRRALSNSEECQAILSRIKSLKDDLPTSATDKPAADGVLTSIRRGLAGAKIPDANLIDIRPMPPTSIPKTKYLRSDTHVSLKAIEVERVLQFVLTQEVQESNIVCSKIDLRAPRSLEKTTAWETQLTFTHILRAKETATKRALKN